MTDHRPASALALTPLLLFLLIFIGTGLFLQARGTELAFYQLSATVAILPAIFLSLLLGKGSFEHKLEGFLRGAGDRNILTMCMIYLLAGGFAESAKSIGGVESTVNFGLALIPAAWVLPGLFLIAAFIATAMGTSMGTIAAIAPIAAAVATKTDLSLPLAMGTIVGGAMFGDNLSMISDTTIAATRTQGCEMADKFKLNLLIALPAALITVAMLAARGTQAPIAETGPYSLLAIFPYVLILVTAVAGMHVFAVLALGIAAAGVIGLLTVPDFTLLTLGREIYRGFTGMQEILILSLFIGGLGERIRSEGGIQFLLQAIERLTRRWAGRAGHRRTGEVGIAALVSFADICTANNTVAILLSGKIAREIAERSGIDPRRSASLLDIFSCIFQGILPYGAQILLAGSIAGIAPLAIVGEMAYPGVLAVFAVLAILSGLPRVRPKVTP